MTVPVTLLLMLAALLLLPAVAMFALECGAALWPARNSSDNSSGKALSAVQRPSIAVLVPAHNEALGIGATLCSIRHQLRTGDRLIVVADNCTDATAELARAAGAEVLERCDRQHRGKGYALDFGRAGLAADPVLAPPQVVMVVDADCQVHPGTVARACCLAQVKQAPVQVTNLLAPPANPSLRDQISAFAFTVRTLARPDGLARLGLPFTLHGTGMAFPWPIFQAIPLASDNLVEDMQLSLDLLLTGHRPYLCRTGRVTGTLPQRAKAAAQQRQRWEHGHLKTLIGQAPRLLRAAWQQRRPELLAVALDLCVPPLALLVLLWLGLSAIAFPWAIWQGQVWPALLLASEGALLLLSVLAVWAKFGRNQLSLTTLLAVPLYLFWKVPIYLSFLLKPQQDWIRASRDKA